MSGMWVECNFTTNFADCGKDPKTSSERIDLTSGVSAKAAVEGRLPIVIHSLIMTLSWTC